MRKQSTVVKPYRRPQDPAEVLSDTALDLVTEEIDIARATDELLRQADRNRELLASVHTAHLQRMAFRSSDDFAYQQALLIIEAALQQLPRSEKPPIDWATPQPGFLRRLLSKIGLPAGLDEPSQ